LSRLWRRVASWCWLLKENGSTASGVSQWLEMWGSWIGYFQTGTLKDLSVRVRQATTRATEFEQNLDEVRVIVEYPLSML
ncbi:OprD family outer membrane porin, partial [Pseudomonas syringae group genomosp. 3]